MVICQNVVNPLKKGVFPFYTKLFALPRSPGAEGILKNMNNLWIFCEQNVNKKFFIFFPKPIDKTLKMCYNIYRKREREEKEMVFGITLLVVVSIIFVAGAILIVAN